MGQLFKNSCYSMITFGMRFLSNAVLFIIIARVLGAEEFGRFAFAVSLSGIFLVVVDYGFSLQIVRDVALAPDRALPLTRGMLNGKIILVLVSTVVIAGYLELLDYPRETKEVVYLLWTAFVFYSFGLFFNSVFRGLNLFKYESYPTLLLNLVQFLLVPLLLFFQGKTLAVALAYLAARVIYFAVSIELVRRRIGRLRFRLDLRSGMASLKGSLPFGIHTILATLYFQLDTVFLSRYAGNAAVGHYQAAMRIVLAAMIVYDVITNAYFPLVAAGFGGREFGRLGLSFNKALVVVGGVIATGVFLYAELAVRLCYGAGYGESVLLLQLLAVVIFLRFAGGGYATVITVADNQKLRAVGVGLSLVFNVAANMVAIPRYGAAGAAVVSILTHLLLVGLYAFFSYRLTRSAMLSRRCLKGLAVLAAGTALCYPAGTFSLAASLAVFAVTLVMVASVALEPEEMQGVRALTRRFRSREA